MLIKPEERAPLAHLLSFLELGEHLAHDCALQQAALSSNEGMCHFFMSQARQESFHARTFRMATRWLGAKHMGASPYTHTLHQFRTQLDQACHRKEFLTTVLAEQVILEGLGEVMLKKLEHGLMKRQASFQKLRQLLLYQEEAHHGFGLRVLERAIIHQDISVSELREHAQPFLQLAERLVLSLADLLYSIDEDPNWYLKEFHQHLPRWLRKPSPIFSNYKFSSHNQCTPETSIPLLEISNV
ncbi:MAG: hypothetical protein O7F12_08190 [Nitrospirae bacterium]|nr:hypothetical protein [Nitrospirota bacterium]